MIGTKQHEVDSSLPNANEGFVPSTAFVLLVAASRHILVAINLRMDSSTAQLICMRVLSRKRSLVCHPNLLVDCPEKNK